MKRFLVFLTTIAILLSGYITLPFGSSVEASADVSADVIEMKVITPPPLRPTPTPPPREIYTEKPKKVVDYRIPQPCPTPEPYEHGTKYYVYEALTKFTITNGAHPSSPNYYSYTVYKGELLYEKDGYVYCERSTGFKRLGTLKDLRNRNFVSRTSSTKYILL